MTHEDEASVNPPAVIYAAGESIVSIPTPVNVASGVGELLGEAAGLLADLATFIVSSDGAMRMADAIMDTHPGPIAGRSPVDPCN